MKTDCPRSLQLWPEGTSVQVRGDIHGGTFRVKFRDSKRWRKATDAERRAIEVEEQAERYVDQEILCNDSSLVSDALREAGDSRSEFAKEWEWENVKNSRTNPEEWGVEECRDWLKDHGCDEPTGRNAVNPWSMTVDELAELWAEIGEDPLIGEHTVRIAVIAAMDEGSIDGIDEWRKAVSDNAEDAEVYQWFRVTDWFASQLDAIDEVVLENNYGNWWGRQCCGQSIIMDGTLQKIAARHA